MYSYIYNLHFKSIRKATFYHYYRAALVLGFQKMIPYYFKLTSKLKKNKLTKNELNDNVFIVSLTTFPARVNKVWLVIESILRQEVKPDKIILWLYKGEFKTRESLPKNLLKLQERGLEIRFCNENLKPHKKYYYTLLEYPNSHIITVDDDIIYPPDLIKNLKVTNVKYPKSICSVVCRRILVVNNKLRHYEEWRNTKKNTIPQKNLSQVGVGGVLYPPNSLHKEVLNLRSLKKHALNADDLWLKIMSIKNQTQVACIAGKYLIDRPFFQVKHENDIKLSDRNVYQAENDIVFSNLLENYNISLECFNDQTNEGS